MENPITKKNSFSFTIIPISFAFYWFRNHDITKSGQSLSLQICYDEVFLYYVQITSLKCWNIYLVVFNITEHKCDPLRQTQP